MVMMMIWFIKFLMETTIPLFSLLCSIVIFWASVFLYGIFDRNYSSYQFVFMKIYGGNNLSTSCVGFGIDGLSMVFILLTAFIFILIFMSAWKYNLKYVNEYCLAFLGIEFFLIMAFLSLDVLVFFFMFESVLVPIFLIMGLWGTLNSKVYASILLFMYTLFGSMCLLYLVLMLYSDVGSYNFSVLAKTYMTLQKQYILWLLGFMAFTVKLPSMPFHMWLPEAHVEAPSAGSVVLAAVLLKLGGYGILSVLLPVLSEASIFYSPLVMMMSIMSMLYTSIMIFSQLDIKRMVAYSSIAHMNLVLMGLFAFSLEGMMGAIFLMVGHGIVSSLLFFVMGFLYESYSSSLMIYYGGLVKTIPLLAFTLLLGCLGNLGFPGLSNFMGEILIFLSMIGKNMFVFGMVLSSIALSGMYSLYLFTSLGYGNLSQSIKIYTDLMYVEILMALPLVFSMVVLGLFPNLIIDVLYSYVYLLLEKTKL